MDSDQSQKIGQLLHLALKQEPSRRSAFITDACGGDEELRREIVSLLGETVPTAPKLAEGSQLGPYKIEGLLGAGGMGEVFRALDTRLDRKVAIKISAERFSDRFDREARAIAALNHPHVCTLYDIGPNYLVMELVEGETLAARLTQGRLPMDQAVRFAMQIADALAEAHARGIVHRDLKPGNIMLTAKGVKLLDFGLAKIADSPGEAQTATLAVIGTPGYMAPEQWEGKRSDHRVDIYAFGSILYEMLTGKRLPCVNGASLEGIPVSFKHLIEQCVAHDREKRWYSARDVELELRWALQNRPTAAPARGRPVWMWVTLSLAALAILAIAFIRLRAPAPPVKAQTVRFRIPLPEDVRGGESFAVSPDNKTLVYAAAGPDLVSRLWAQRLDSLEARPLSGTELLGGEPPPFWSPDSKFIVYYSGSKLKRTDLSGSPPQTICAVPGATIGGSWNSDGMIIFGRDTGGLMRVAAAGGEPVPLTSVDRARGERLHGFPTFLPDGRHFLYSRFSSVPENNGVYVGSLDAKPGEPVARPLIGTLIGVAFVPSTQGSGRVLFQRDRTLWTQELDISRFKLTGDPVPVAEHVGSALGGGAFSVSDGGALVYRTAATPPRQMKLVDRAGKEGALLGPPVRPEARPILSPDGTRVALAIYNGSSVDLWLYDLARNVNQRLTSDPGLETNPVWSPDGKRIAFSSSRSGHFDLYQVAVNGAGPEELLYESAENKTTTSWSADGKFLLYGTDGADTNGDIWALPLEATGKRTPIPVVRTRANEALAMFSPDARWIASISDDSGTVEVYVQPFTPGAGVGAAKTLVSRGGGNGPRWRADGKELFYRRPDGMIMSVSVTPGVEFRPGEPQPLFKTPFPSFWDAAGDGNRFLLAVPVGPAAPEPFTVVLDWWAGLKK
jgi:Tol biopolymer transport system component/predicted Ser/Thr protein kinase